MHLREMASYYFKKQNEILKIPNIKEYIHIFARIIKMDEDLKMDEDMIYLAHIYQASIIKIKDRSMTRSKNRSHKTLFSEDHSIRGTQ